MIKRLKNSFKKKDKTLVKVYSHPRSGTHFLEAFLAKNFYKGEDLYVASVTWGHWSNRQINPEGNLYGKLFGNHKFPNKKNTERKIYIARDGRAVAYSVWKTPNFLHKDISNLSFKEFLRTPIDWYGTPSNKKEANLTIFEHWAKHINSWNEFAVQNDQLLIINYEDLIAEPYQQYLKIHNRYFSDIKKLKPEEIDVIKKPVGLLPNKATADTWKSFFEEEDLLYFNKVIKNRDFDIQ